MIETPILIVGGGPVGLSLAAELGWRGTHLGYRYVESPVICAAGTPEPPDDFMQVVPSTWPGSRAPHAWLSADTSVRGMSTLDWFGRGYVLLHGPGSADGGALLSALKALGAPCRAQALPAESLTLYEKLLVLVRPDGHLCWRGDVAPADPRAVAARVTGRVA